MLSGNASTGDKPKRLVDSLDLPRQPLKELAIIPGLERSMGLDPGQVPRGSRKREPPRDSKSPVGPIERDPQLRRMTRSQDAQQASNPQTMATDTNTPPKVKLSETGILGKPWAKDLVYPRPGKKSATVPFEDLRRLDDDEFLNDNLISFFIQYLETHLEKNCPDLYKRMYFFNTYFYEALTKTSRGKKGINFDAVSRWTKNINIFSRDFVIVPVNENFHWYLAIICNLRYFGRDPGDESDGHIDTTLQPVDDFSTIGQQAEEMEQGADAPTEETQRSLADLSISDSEQNSQPPSKTQHKKGPGRRKAVRRSLPKYETDKPIIITLDSLGSSRSATCALLKQYVVLEGKDKRALDLDVSDLRGMTAKEIPTQGNFSDCGLYLCMYLEQFAADPYKFVRRILQREENTQQWPLKIQSQDLRSRLRELILEIHRRQEQEPSTTEIPEIGSIMIPKRDLSPEQVEVQKKVPTKQDIELARQRFEEIADAQERLAAQKDLAGAEDQEEINDELWSSAARATATSATEIPNTPDEDGDLTATIPTANVSRRQPPPRHESNTNTLDTMTQVRASPTRHAHNSPGELASIMRRGNESHKRRRIDAEEGLDKGRSKSHSAPRELLAGIESYTQGSSTSPCGYNSGTDGADNRASDPEDSPEPEVVAERKVNPEEALLGTRKRKRPRSEEEERKESDERAETPATPGSSLFSTQHAPGHDGAGGGRTVRVPPKRDAPVDPEPGPGRAGRHGHSRGEGQRQGHRARASEEDGEMLLR